MSARRMDQAVVNNHGAFIWRIANLYDHAIAQDDQGELDRLELFRKDVDTHVKLYDLLLANVAHKSGAAQKLDLAGDHIALDPLTVAGSGAASDPVLVALADVIRRMNDVFDGGSFDDTDIGALSRHVVTRMLENPVVRTQVANNTQQQVAESPALKAGFTDALVGAQAAYGELVKQLFDGDAKRVDYFHSLITLLYAESANAGDRG